MKGDVSVNNLSFTYPDGSNALNNLSIQIRNKEKVAILGANGAGKTTFVMHLNGVNRIQKGTVIIGGKDLNDDNINSIRKEVGIVFQDPDNQLFMPTVYEDVTFGPKNFGFDDKEIEKNLNITIKKIFEVKGENYFRKIEEQTTLKKLKLNSTVISLGGGAFTNNNIRKEILKNHLSFWLNWDDKTLLNRIKNSKKRPLAINATDTELIDLIKKRSNIYSKALYEIKCDNLSKSEIVNEIVKIYETN